MNSLAIIKKCSNFEGHPKLLYPICHLQMIFEKKKKREIIERMTSIESSLLVALYIDEDVYNLIGAIESVRTSSFEWIEHLLYVNVLMCDWVWLSSSFQMAIYQQREQTKSVSKWKSIVIEMMTNHCEQSLRLLITSNIIVSCLNSVQIHTCMAFKS